MQVGILILCSQNTFGVIETVRRQYNILWRQGQKFRWEHAPWQSHDSRDYPSLFPEAARTCGSNLNMVDLTGPLQVVLETGIPLPVTKGYICSAQCCHYTRYSCPCSQLHVTRSTMEDTANMESLYRWHFWQDETLPNLSTKLMCRTQQTIRELDNEMHYSSRNAYA